MSIKIDSLPVPPPLVETINSTHTVGNSTRTMGGEVVVWWLGQAGFALRCGKALFLIDPYLSDSLAEKYRGSEFKYTRMMASPLDPRALVGCTAYLCTHGHTDHMDAQTIQAVLENNCPQFVAPRAEVARARQCGVPLDRAHLINAGESINLDGGITVEALASAHEEFEQDEFGNQKFLGYILTLGGVRLYHSGDPIPYAGLVEQLAAKKIDVALLPINGRDALRRSRGVPGNFTLEEAIALCRAAGIPHLIGHHFGLFDFNTIDPTAAAAILRDQAADLDWLLPEVGVTYRLRRI